MKTLILLSVISGLVGCAHNTPHHCMIDPAVLPTKMYYSVAGAWGGGCLIQCDGETITVKRTPYSDLGGSPKPSKTLSFRPCESEWDAFWRQMAILQLFQWRSSYSPSDVEAVVDDGSRWTLQISHAGQTISSGGDNAYPGPDNVKKTSLNDDRLRLFDRAIEKLIGHTIE